jgi:hypothetical protein
MLDSDNYKCQDYMPKLCNAEWGELGREILRERAAQGDSKAGYALYRNLKYKKPGFG